MKKTGAWAESKTECTKGTEDLHLRSKELLQFRRRTRPVGNEAET